MLAFKSIDIIANRSPDDACASIFGKKYTYQQIKTLSDKVAAGLQKLKIGPQKTVGLYMTNAPSYLAAYFGILKSGATVVNLNPLLPEKETRFQIENSGIEAIFTHNIDPFLKTLSGIKEKTRLKTIITCPTFELARGHKKILFPLLWRPAWGKTGVVTLKQLTDNNGKYKKHAIKDQNTPAILQYTGGTTGTSKAAVISHLNIAVNVSQAQQMSKKLHLEFQDGKEKILATAPFFHSMGMIGVMNCAINGGNELILSPNPKDVNEVIHCIKRYAPTVLPAVPRLLEMICAHPEASPKNLSSVKYIMCGGGILPDSLIKKAKKLMPQSKILSFYGLTEATSIVTAGIVTNNTPDGFIGRPVPRTSITLVKPDKPDEPACNGEIGEICIKGPQVFKGFYKDRKATTATFNKYGLRTGDLAFRHPDNSLIFSGRLKNMIKSNGQNIYVERIEAEILKYPGIVDCAMIAEKDGDGHEIPCLYIKTAQNQFDGAAFKKFMHENFQSFEIPRKIKTLDKGIPKTPFLKTDHQALKNATGDA